jgi:hypothetical protein
MQTVQPDLKFLKLMRDLDAERTARKKAEQLAGRLRGVLKRVKAQRGQSSGRGAEL